LREETDLDALNAELVGVARETIQPHRFLCGGAPIRLRSIAEGKSNPIVELGEQMYASRFRCLSK